MKFFSLGKMWNTKTDAFDVSGQFILDDCLGPGQVRLEVLQYDQKVVEFNLWRNYGDWFHVGSDEDVFCLDEGIIEGHDFQPGKWCDLKVYPHYFMVYHHVDDVFENLKQKQKEFYGSRLKSMECKTFIDHINVKIEAI